MTESTNQKKIDQTQLADDVSAFRKAVEIAGHDVRFTEAEVKALKQWSQFVIGLQAIGRMAGLFKSGIVWIGIMVGSVAAFNGWLREWLIALIGTGR